MSSTLRVLASMLWACSASAFSSEAPHIIEQPLDVTVARHQPATLYCRAGGRPAPSVRWYRDGTPVQPDSHRVLLPSGSLFFLRAAHGRTHSDAGVYWCEATNAYGTARSRNATLHVAVLREEFRLEPVSMQMAQGETVLLECTPPRGIPEPTVYWKKNGDLMTLDSDSRMQLVDGGSLVIQDASQADAGRYQCVARNAAGTRESAVATLNIHIKPYLVTGPEDIIAQTGGSVTFQCRVGGDPLPDVLWRRTAGGGNMPLGRVRILEDRSLRIDSITISDEGEYSCEADNSVGAVTASGILTVYDPPTVQLRPYTVSVDVGEIATFECLAKGRPDPAMFWSLEGNRTLIFPGTTRDRYIASIIMDGVSRLTLTVANKSDSGSTIVCSAVNFAGSAFSRAKLLVSSDDDRPPPIITHGPSNQTLPIKSMAVFHCNAIGMPTPVISWYHEGIAVVQSSKRNISQAGTLLIKDLSKDDTGLYTCVASSRNGKYVWSGNLIVDTPTNPSLNFFRAPDMSTLPGAPTRPIIVNESDTSVTLSWSQNNKIGSSSLIGYQIEVFAREMLSGQNTPRNSHGWIPITRRVHGTVYTARMLTPGLTYIFMVRAENSHGLSAPSPVSDPVTISQDSRNVWEIFSNVSDVRSNLLTDDIVELIEASPIDSETIKVMWEVLNFYYLEGLFIYFRTLDDTSNNSGEYQVKKILHSNDVSGYEISSLKKYTKYEFFLIPFYKKFEGKPSNSRVSRTLDDVPDGPPIDIELFVLNTTTVHLKWAEPKAHLQNGLITIYNVIVNWLDVAANKSTVAINTTVESGTSLVMTNLTAGVTYTVQIAAATAVGFGPLSNPVLLCIDSRGIDSDVRLNRYPNDNGVSIVAGDFVMETWFLFLIGAIAVFKILLIVAVFFLRKHNFFSKKGALPNIYDTNGTSLVTQMNIKAAVSLSHPLSSCYNKNSVTKTESLLWMENQPGLCLANDKLDGNEKANPEYDKVANAQPAPEYAEVTSSRVAGNDWNGGMNATSPAAYASVTLVANTRQCVSSLGWFPSTNKNNETFDARFNQDEEIYPASNGGYYNRNVYADKYFQQGQSNVIKFYDFPSSVTGGAKGQKAQLRYNQSLDGDSQHMNISSYDGSRFAKGDSAERSPHSLASQGYGAGGSIQRDKEKAAAAEEGATYRVGSVNNGGEESEEENYFGNSASKGKINYGNVKAMKLLNHHYARPSFEYEAPSATVNPSRTLSRFTSFKRPEDGGHRKESVPR